MSNQPTIEWTTYQADSLPWLRDSLAMEIMAQMLGKGEAHLWGGVDTLYAEYLALADEIARRGEPVQQGRLGGIA